MTTSRVSHVGGAVTPRRTARRNTGTELSTALQYDFGASVTRVSFQTEAAHQSRMQQYLEAVLFGQLNRNDVATAPKVVHVRSQADCHAYGPANDVNNTRYKQQPQVKRRYIGAEHAGMPCGIQRVVSASARRFQ